MSQINNRYFKTTGIYEGADTICVSVDYIKGKGYYAVASPCGRAEGMISICICSEYFTYSGFKIDCIESSRRNKAKELKAIEHMNDNIEKILKDYCAFCFERGAINIEIISDVNSEQNVRTA